MIELPFWRGNHFFFQCFSQKYFTSFLPLMMGGEGKKTSDTPIWLTPSQPPIILAQKKNILCNILI